MAHSGKETGLVQIHPHRRFLQNCVNLPNFPTVIVEVVQWLIPIMLGEVDINVMSPQKIQLAEESSYFMEIVVGKI